MRFWVVAWLWSTAAFAAEVRSVDSFVMPFEAPGLCVIFSEQCGDVDPTVLPKLKEQLGTLAKEGQELIGIGMLHLGAWRSMVFLLRAPHVDNEPFAREALRDYVRGVAAGTGESVGRELVPLGDPPYETIEFAGTVGIRSVALAATDYIPGADRVLTYMLFSSRNVFSIVAMANREHEPEVRSMIDSWLQKTSLTPVTESQRRRFDQESDFEFGRRMGHFVGRWLREALIVFAALMFLRWAYKRFRKRST